jgi:metallo-beta-lactamase family protein
LVKITLTGAAGGEVTGSAYFVQTKKARVLVDCGMFQGGKKSESLNRPPVRPKSKLDTVLLTHGHLDHTGRLPLLAQMGFRGPVFATPATIDMAALILRDSAKIQVHDAERKNRRLERAGKPPVEPLYVIEEAEQIIAQMRSVSYKEPVQIADGIEATWVEAGHMLGSASIQLVVDDDGKRKSVVFSGDLGPKGIPILRDFEPFQQADVVFLESTYGDRNHRPFNGTVDEFVRIVKQAVSGGGKILVPTFAVGRAQLLIGLLGWMFRCEKIQPFPVFLDSPMAIQATKIYGKHREIFDDNMKKFIAEKPLRDDLVTLKPTVTAQESMQINDHKGTCLILAGSGMCNGGRIVHHLSRNLWKEETHVMIVGFQGYGSLGRRLVEGQPRVTIEGEKVVVRAQVHTLSGFSAHCGQTDLLNWLAAVAPSKPDVVLTHGEDGPRKTLAGEVRRRFGLKTSMPRMGEVLEF